MESKDSGGTAHAHRSEVALSPDSGHSTSTRGTPYSRLNNYLQCVYAGTIMTLTYNNQMFYFLLSVTLKYLLKIIKHKLNEKVRL